MFENITSYMNSHSSKRFLILLIIFISACKPSTKITEPDEYINLQPIEIKAYSDLDIYRSSRQRDFDLLHTKLEVSFNWDSTFLYGKASILLKPYFYAQSNLILDAKGFQINEIAQLDEIGIRTPLLYSYDSSKINIALGKTYSKDDTLEIFIDYIAMPNKLKVGGSKAITSDKGLYFINPDGSDTTKPRQIWTQGETEASSCWFPTIDSPNEKTTQEIFITVDSNFVSLSNGTLLFQTENADGTRTDYWKQNLPHAPYLFMMAIGEFAIVKDEWKDKEVNYYVEPEFKDNARDIFPNTVEMLDFFSSKLNYDYPWDKFDQVVVRDYVSGAMENTSAVIYGEFVQGDGRFLIDNAAEDVVAHELFHHWFGDLVTCESWSNLPLNEAFATYGEYLWFEHKYGSDFAEHHLNKDLNIYLMEARSEQKELIRYHYLKREDMFDSHSYQKGGRVLHMLRKIIGDEAFFASLNLYLTKYEYQSTEIHQLRLAFEEITGQDLQWFFNQWFLKPGHPEVEVNYEFIEASNTLKFTVNQLQSLGDVPPAFILPTNIEVAFKNGEKQLIPIEINMRNQVFEIPLKSKPLFAKLDANNDLLAVINQDIKTTEAVFLYEFGENYLDRHYAIDLIKSKADSVYLTIIEKGLSDPFWDVRKLAIENSSKLALLRPETTKQLLSHLALQDKKSIIRGKAIQALANNFESYPISEFKKALNDTSFQVVASAIEAIYSRDSKEGVLIAESFQDEFNPDINASVASIFAIEAKPQYNSFYINSIKNVDTYSLYNLVMTYGEFLKQQGDKVITDSFSTLKNVGQNQAIWFVRMASIYTLIDLFYVYEEKNETIEKQLVTETNVVEIEKLNVGKRNNEKMQISIRNILSELNKTESEENVKVILNQFLN